MRVFSEQLAEQLQAGLRACYLIFGDEPLQKMEALQQIRHVAREQGFTDVYRFSASEEPLPWDHIHACSQSLSLFSSRQIIEIELGDKLPKEWAERVTELQQQLHPDLLLIILGPRLNSSQSKSGWFTTLDKQGIYIPVALPDARYFPRWMKLRSQQNGLRIDNDGITFLCHAFEGNLLAAAQELEKLALLALPQPLTVAVLQHNITRHNVFDPFKWLDTLLEGKSQRALRMLAQLRDEGVEPGMLTWALAKDLELLWSLRLAQDARQPLTSLLQAAKIWPSRQTLVQQAMQRLPADQLRGMLRMMSELDRSNRTFDSATAWQWLQTLSLAFRGSTSLRFTLPVQL
ncbi:DNA polymerase III subunit delta [Tolumonas auensis]|uniref:DNA polymerase III subunit delta n=1 Tax=Tolumonas auensis TaxID=43948 RepID=UPI002AA6F253|nr:DNA polymerase III subunit delta [Tolumonas auensis]